MIFKIRNNYQIWKPETKFFVFLVIGLMMSILWKYGEKTNFIPCVSDCGETFVAQKQVKDFQLYGLKYGLFQDHATSNNIDAHPFLYTHNVSIPSIVFPILDWLGVQSFVAKQFLTVFVFGAGLFYIFLAAFYYSRSYLVAISLLMFFCTDYYHVFSFGLNALRAWHWLLLFGLLFHGGRYLLERDKFPKLDRIMLAVFSTLAFGIGYDFWIICLSIITVLTAAIFFMRPKNARIILVDFLLISFFFFFPVFLRQIHVVIVLGADFWYKDFFYSAAIKVPFLKKIIPLPSMEEINTFYNFHNILRPPATQHASWTIIKETFLDMFKNIIIPSFGTFNIWCFALVSVFISMLFIYAIFNFFKTKIESLNSSLKSKIESLNVKTKYIGRLSLLLLWFASVEAIDVRLGGHLGWFYPIGFLIFSIILVVTPKIEILKIVIFLSDFVSKYARNNKYTSVFWSVFLAFSLMISWGFLSTNRAVLLSKMYLGVLIFFSVTWLFFNRLRKFQVINKVELFLIDYFNSKLNFISTSFATIKKQLKMQDDNLVTDLAANFSLIVAPLLVISLKVIQTKVISNFFSFNIIGLSLLAFAIKIFSFFKGKDYSWARNNSNGVLPDMGQRWLAFLVLFFPIFFISLILVAHSSTYPVLFQYSFSYLLILTTFNALLTIIFFLILYPNLVTPGIKKAPQLLLECCLNILRKFKFSLNFYPSLTAGKVFLEKNQLQNINSSNSLQNGLKLFLILTIGISIGLLVFAPFSLHVYLKHQFPLLAAPILFAKTIIFSAIILIFFRFFYNRFKMCWVVLALAVFILADHVILQINNANYFKPISTSWISAIEARKNATFAVSWTSDCVAAYANNWVVGLTPGVEHKVVERLKQGKRPFELSDYFLFGQRDIKNKENQYLKPDYWLYFPVEQSNQFDSPSPVCRKDYISNFLDLFSFNKSPKKKYFYNLKSSEASGVLSGQLLNANASVSKIELISQEGKVLKTFDYNCIYGTFTTTYSMPENYDDSPVTVVATYNGSKKVTLSKFYLRDNMGITQEMIKGMMPTLRRKQMTVDEIISTNPNLTIAEHGSDYVIFDMRKVYEELQ